MTASSSRSRLLLSALASLSLATFTACGSSSDSSSNDNASSSPANTSTQQSTVSAAAGNAADVWKTADKPCGSVENFVSYVCGKPGAADASLKPVKLGWVNNQGGTIVSLGPQATKAAQFAVDWVNKYASGIGGHPLQLVTCYVKNSEEEGKACADKFLADKDIHVVSYGSLGPGAQTVNAGLKSAGIPVVEGFAINPSDVTSPNHFILFTAQPFDYYAWGTLARDTFKAKKVAIVYPQGTGFQNSAAAADTAIKTIGIQVKSVGYNPDSTNLVGALVASGAQSADMVVNVGGTPSTCVAIAKGLKQLKIPDEKVVGDFACALASEKEAYGGDIPKWYFGQAQSGDGLTDSPVGQQYRAALAAFGHEKDRPDVWYSGMFGSILTNAQFLNKVGADKLSPTAIKAQVSKWRGPLLLGQPKPYCGKYPSAPANCGGGDRFFRYEGNDKWTPVSTWTDVPIELQRKLNAKGVQ
jgi:branched-chain amino acid transport system substrate-binding protein